MRSSSRLEVEIKLPVADPAALRRQLRALGFRLAAPRARERNWIFDDPSGRLRRSGRLLRLRRQGRAWRLTAKGPALPGRHKRRPEIELPLRDGEAFRRLLLLLGFVESWFYEKYRARYRPPRSPGSGEAALDQTPIGWFLELEGPPAWIDRTAHALGYRRADYILASYADLFRRWHPRGPMKFES